MRLYEWQVMNSNPATSVTTTNTGSTGSYSPTVKTNKEKFTELVDYMSNNLSPDVTVDYTIDNSKLTYTEHWNKPKGRAAYDMTVTVDFGKYKSYWKFTFHIDSKRINKNDGVGWEDLLKELRVYFKNIPVQNSPEYVSLTEACTITNDFKLYEDLWT
jgi:hypothetical protein